MNKRCIGEKASPNKFKCILKIKRTAVFTFCVLFFSVKSSYSQQFTFKEKSVAIKEVCNSIEKESDFIFVFSDHSEAKIGKKIEIDVHAKNVTEVLDIIFSGTGLAYRILDKQIVVYETKSMPTEESTRQRNVIIGAVVDAKTGDPLTGASILVKNSDPPRGATADADGKFELAATSSDVLVVSFIGYVTKELRVGNQKILNIPLSEDAQALGEVVVSAFNTGQKKATMTGSIQTLRPSDLKVPATNLSTAFAGRLAGVIAYQRSGEPGSKTRKKGAE